MLIRNKFGTGILLVLSAFSFAIAIADQANAPGCPDSAVGETIEDCPWAPSAKAMAVDSNKQIDPLESLRQNAPGIAEQIQKDSKERSDYFNLWGLSINFDELAKGVIVHPYILKSIGKAAGVELNMSDKVGGGFEPYRIVHAGLEHTYGYLFSVLKTPFGYKRARWVRPEIEDGFALPHGSLGPNAQEGTLLSNVTWFLGKIAFRTEPQLLETLDKNKKGLPSELTSFDFSKLKVTRLEEKVQAGSQQKARTVVIRTDFVTFTVKPKSQSANSNLLVYSITDGVSTRLISGFPVQESFVTTALDPANLGEGKPVITRYNAFVEGVTGQSLKGSRKVLKASQTR